jgi:serine/threonine-protein kinase RsbW
MANGLTLRLRRAADTVPRVRGMVGQELSRHGVDDDVVDRVVLASAEACNNAILHARGATYRVTIEVDADNGGCTVTITDSGGGFDVPDEPPMPGPAAIGQRGLALMSALVDEITVDSTDDGTTVVIQHTLNGKPGITV